MKFPISIHRKMQIAGLMLCLVAIAVPANAQTTTSSSADWTQFLRDNMQRWNPYETLIGVNNAGSLHLKWKIPVGGDIPATPSAPAVVNGVVYIGGDDNSMYALNASTGAKLWSYITGGGIYSSPAVANGVVYFGSRDHNVYALNTSTGAELWSFDTGFEVGASPTVANGVVYIGSAVTLLALNASTGAVLWSFPETSEGFGSSPAVVNGVVYATASDGKVYALNASTGAKLWSYVTGRGISSSPAVANGVVYFGVLPPASSSTSNIYALNANTGALLWSFATPGFVEASPTVANGVVYIVDESASATSPGYLYALNASTGAVLWRYANQEFNRNSSPAVANGVVYVGSFDGYLHASNASTGAKLWSYSLGDDISPPSIVNGVVYVHAGNTGQTGNLYAFATSVGTADLYLRVQPSSTTVHQGDVLTFAFPVWNLGPGDAVQEVLNTQVPAGTTFDYVRISGTPGLGTCTTPRYGGTGQVVCHENSSMAPNTTWTVRLTVFVTAAPGTVITENAATMADTTDPNMANNTATVSLTVR